MPQGQIQGLWELGASLLQPFAGADTAIGANFRCDVGALAAKKVSERQEASVASLAFATTASLFSTFVRSTTATPFAAPKHMAGLQAMLKSALLPLLQVWGASVESKAAWTAARDAAATGLLELCTAFADAMAASAPYVSDPLGVELGGVISAEQRPLWVDATPPLVTGKFTAAAASYAALVDVVGPCGGLSGVSFDAFLPPADAQERYRKTFMAAVLQRLRLCNAAAHRVPALSTITTAQLSEVVDRFAALQSVSAGSNTLSMKEVGKIGGLAALAAARRKGGSGTHAAALDKAAAVHNGFVYALFLGRAAATSPSDAALVQALQATTRLCAKTLLSTAMAALETSPVVRDFMARCLPSLLPFVSATKVRLAH